MNLEVCYKIKEVQDEFGNIKENIGEGRLFYIYNVFVGAVARLINVKNHANMLRTSRVEKIEILDNHIIITTLNSRYVLEAVIRVNENV